MDSFVIRESYGTGHECGLVVVLDALITRDVGWLAGAVADVRTADGSTRRYTVDEAREHGSVNSLFFRGLDKSAVPIGCELTIAIPFPQESQTSRHSLAS